MQEPSTAVLNIITRQIVSKEQLLPEHVHFGKPPKRALLLDGKAAYHPGPTLLGVCPGKDIPKEGCLEKMGRPPTPPEYLSEYGVALKKRIATV